jgi:hypothetical protein
MSLSAQEIKQKLASEGIVYMPGAWAYEDIAEYRSEPDTKNFLQLGPTRGNYLTPYEAAQIIGISGDDLNKLATQSYYKAENDPAGLRIPTSDFSRLADLFPKPPPVDTGGKSGGLFGFIDSALSAVGSTVGKIGDYVSTTISNIAENPLPTIATIALTAVGVPAPLANAMVTAATGGDMEQIVLSAAASYAGGQIGQQIGGAFAPDQVVGGAWGDEAFSASVKPDLSQQLVQKIVTDASSGAATAALQGKDFDQILAAGVSAVVGPQINNVLKTEFGLDPKDLSSKLVSDSVKSATQAILNNTDPATAIGNAIGGTLMSEGFSSLVGPQPPQRRPAGIYDTPVLADEFGVSGREDDQLLASDSLPEVTLSQSDVSGLEDLLPDELQQLGLGTVDLPSEPDELDDIFESLSTGPTLPEDKLFQELIFGESGPRFQEPLTGITFPGGETITFDDGSSITFGPTGEITSLIDSEGVEVPITELTPPTIAPEMAGPVEIPEEIIEPEEVIDPEEAERLAEEARIEEERLAEEARVTAEQERLAEEARQAEAERVANEERAQLFGFPNYATYQQFEGNYERYLDAQNELMAKGAEFPDYKTYMEYGGDLNAYEQDLLERDAIAAGFPDHFTQVQYGGSYDAYQADLLEQARVEEESIAREEGFPDLVTKQQYNGDLASFKNDQAVAEGWPDAETKEEYGTFERYQQHLKDEADLEERGRLWEQQQQEMQDALNDELTQINGFPDYATYLEFDGDQDAYLASLTPPVVEPEEPTEPVVEPPYTPGEDAEEFEQIGEPPVEPPAEEPVEVTEPPYTPGEDAAEFQPPYTPGEDAEEFIVSPEVPYTPGEDAEELLPPYTPGEDSVEVMPPYTPGEDAEEFIPPYTPGEDAAEFIPPYTPGEDAGDFVPPYTPGEDADEFIPPYTPGEDADEFEPEEEIDPETGLPRIKISPPKQPVPPKKPVTPLPPGLTPDQLMQLFGQLGAPGITGALQPYEMPYYFQIPEEQQFDITQAFSPTLYRLQKE